MLCSLTAVVDVARRKRRWAVSVLDIAGRSGPGLYADDVPAMIPPVTLVGQQ